MSRFSPARVPSDQELHGRLYEPHPNAAVLAHLAHSPDAGIRTDLAGHPALFIAAAEAAGALVHDPVSAVRAALAMNPRLAPAAAMQLADDPDWRTRRREAASVRRLSASRDAGDDLAR